MTTMDTEQIRDEICQFIRMSDVLSTSVRGVTRTVSTYTVGVGGEATHTFTGNIPVKDFKSLKVDSTDYYYLRDYTINWDTGVLTWNTPLIAGQVVVYSIDWGNTDKIFPDFPRDGITFDSFPRVGIDLTSVSTEPRGLGGTVHMSDLLVTITVWVSAEKNNVTNFGGLVDLESTINLIRSSMRTNAKSFYTFPYIYPKGQSPLIRGKNDKVLQRSGDFFIRFRIE